MYCVSEKILFLSRSTLYVNERIIAVRKILQAELTAAEKALLEQQLHKTSDSYLSAMAIRAKCQSCTAWFTVTTTKKKSKRINHCIILRRGQPCVVDMIIIAGTQVALQGRLLESKPARFGEVGDFVFEVLSTTVPVAVLYTEVCDTLAYVDVHSGVNYGIKISKHVEQAAL